MRFGVIPISLYVLIVVSATDCIDSNDSSCLTQLDLLESESASVEDATSVVQVKRRVKSGRIQKEERQIPEAIEQGEREVAPGFQHIPNIVPIDHWTHILDPWAPMYNCDVGGHGTSSDCCDDDVALRAVCDLTMQHDADGNVSNTSLCPYVFETCALAVKALTGNEFCERMATEFHSQACKYSCRHVTNALGLGGCDPCTVTDGSLASAEYPCQCGNATHGKTCEQHAMFFNIGGTPVIESQKCTAAFSKCEYDCNRHNGEAPSTSYPCQCGTAQCHTGQWCTAESNKCEAKCTLPNYTAFPNGAFENGTALGIAGFYGIDADGNDLGDTSCHPGLIYNVSEGSSCGIIAADGFGCVDPGTCQANGTWTQIEIRREWDGADGSIHWDIISGAGCSPHCSVQDGSAKSIVYPCACSTAYCTIGETCNAGGFSDGQFCQAYCTVPTISAGVAAWAGTNCASGASDVVSGTQCNITASAGYECDSPGLCRIDGTFRTVGRCLPDCSIFDGSGFSSAYPCKCGPAECTNINGARQRCKIKSVGGAAVGSCMADCYPTDGSEPSNEYPCACGSQSANILVCYDQAGWRGAHSQRPVACNLGAQSCTAPSRGGLLQISAEAAPNRLPPSNASKLASAELALLEQPQDQVALLQLTAVSVVGSRSRIDPEVRGAVEAGEESSGSFTPGGAEAFTSAILSGGFQQTLEGFLIHKPLGGSSKEHINMVLVSILVAVSLLLATTFAVEKTYPEIYDILKYTGPKSQRPSISLIVMLVTSYALLIPALTGVLFSFQVGATVMGMHIYITSQDGHPGSVTDSSLGVIALLARNGCVVGAVLVTLYAIIVPAAKVLLILSGEYWRESHPQSSRKCIIVVQYISKWACPDMFAYILLLYLIRHIPANADGMIDSHSILGVGFSCFSIFCIMSTMTSLLIVPPPKDDGPEDGNSIFQTLEPKVIFPASMALLAVFAVLLFVGVGVPCMGLNIDPDALLEPNGIIPVMFKPILDSLDLGAKLDTTVPLASAIYQSAKYASDKGEGNSFLGVVMLCVFALIFPICSMLCLVVAAWQLPSMKEGGPNTAMPFAKVLAKIGMLDVFCMGVVIVPFAFMANNMGLNVYLQPGVFILLAAEMTHYFTHWLVAGAIEAHSYDGTIH